MFYAWDYTKNENGDFFRCGMEQFEGWTGIPWNMGGKITKALPSILKYYAVNMSNPEDFPMTGTYFHFLVSEKITTILKKLEVKGVDYYESEIIRPNGEVLYGYSTLNIINSLECLDKNSSEFVIKQYGPAQVYKFSKICFDLKMIPPEVKIFSIREIVSIFVHQSIKDALEEAKITGVDFKPIYISNN